MSRSTPSSDPRRRATAEPADRGADLGTIRDALIVLGGFLPFFASEPAKVERAKRVGVLRDEAFDALNRLARALGEEPPKRQTDWHYK